MKHLIYQCAAASASFGNENARLDRTTDDRPRKSAFLGQVAAGMGKKRGDPWHSTADAALGFAFVVLRSGYRFSDYHTVHTPAAGRVFDTRKEEFEAAEHCTPTIRDYLSDVYFLIAFWQKPAGPGAELEIMKYGLESPVFELFVGRKACTLSLPPAPEIYDVATLADAFRAYKGRLYPPLLGEDKTFRIYWEDHPASGLSSSNVIQRQDAMVDRVRRLYRARLENEGGFSF